MTNDDTLQHIKDVEMLILKDFISICDEHNIDYYLFYGSEIGAVRHEGFIPWDDDIDIAMFRDDYEKFLKVMEDKKSEKYTIFDSRYNEEYFFQFGRMSLNGTYWAEFWDDQVSFYMGIHLDLFILDKIPNNKFKRQIYMKRCLLLAKFYAISAIKLEETSIVQKLINVFHVIFNAIGLKPKFFKNRLLKVYTKYENKDYDYCTDLTMNEQCYFKISDFKPVKKAMFEGIEVKIPNNQDSTLGSIFGDYMSLPPEEERVCHVLNEIDFGKF